MLSVHHGDLTDEKMVLSVKRPGRENGFRNRRQALPIGVKTVYCADRWATAGKRGPFLMEKNMDEKMDDRSGHGSGVTGKERSAAHDYDRHPRYGRVRVGGGQLGDIGASAGRGRGLRYRYRDRGRYADGLSGSLRDHAARLRLSGGPLGKSKDFERRSVGADSCDSGLCSGSGSGMADDMPFCGRLFRGRDHRGIAGHDRR